ncbi:MAG: S8 family serine peptidase [FCB group bacterium]|nr:S8 family serine peptidase [FCB group bacterium]MBL7028453.1 S8 family serine peptidase [Candidatus Neomarinimicrobiota bacterium]MBL7122367.1 S8 family serine peptidase [Candidatus Neomarinimicrobiota bacterium]
MKTVHILLIIPFLITLCFSETLANTDAVLDQLGRPVWEENTLTIKLNQNIAGLSYGRSNSLTNIRTLDNLFVRYSVNSISPSFKLNPKKMRPGLPDLSQIYKLDVSPETNLETLITALEKDAHVIFAERIPLFYTETFPNDSLYSVLAHLPQIQAEEAWDIHKGEDGVEEIVIGIVDSGIDWKHPDLAANVYNNLGEDADGDGHTIELIDGEYVFDPDDENGIDDDANGYIDDFSGWNVTADGEGNQNNDPMDPIGGSHGTHVAGLASGVTNNSIGIAAVAWNVKVSATSHSYDNVNGYVLNAFQGIIYHAENGVDIINNSWGGNAYSEAGHEVIQYATGMGSIVVASAGNGGSNYSHYPSDYPGVISVAAVTQDDYKTAYSNFGPGVDVSAPGGSNPGLLSTYPINDDYIYSSGTSMAGPVAASALALLKSYHPDWSNDEILRQYLATTDDLSALEPGYEHLIGYGRVNAYRALSEVNPNFPLEMRLGLHEIIASNPAGFDHEYAPGDTTTLSFILRNYAMFTGDSSATFTLTTADPTISISPASLTDSIHADDFSLIEGGFHIDISPATPSQIATFNLNISPSQGSIASGENLSFTMVINAVQVVEPNVSVEVEYGESQDGYLTVVNSGMDDVNFQISAIEQLPYESSWHLDQFMAYEGESWWCGDDILDQYPRATCDILQLPVLDLSSTTNPHFTFMGYWDIEDPSESPPYDGWDAANVWISLDGGIHFEPIYPDFPAYTCESVYSMEEWFEGDSMPGWAGTNGDYEQVQFDLTPYREERVVLRLVLTSDAVASDVGIFVDNILVADQGDVLYSNTGEEDFKLKNSGSTWWFDGLTSWITFDNASTTVQANGSVEIPYSINTLDLTLGGYISELRLISDTGIPIGNLECALYVAPPTYDLGIRNYSITGGHYRVASQDTLSIILDNYGSEDAWEFLVSGSLIYEDEVVWSDSISVAVLEAGQYRELIFDPYFVDIEGELDLHIEILDFEEDLNDFNNEVSEELGIETIVDRFWYYYTPYWNYGEWDFSTMSGYQDGQSMHCNHGVTPYEPNMDNALTFSPGIDIGLLETFAIKYRALYQLEDGADFGTFEVSTDQENWTILNSHTGTAISWNRHEIDLTEYCGGEYEKLWFRFHFTSDGQNEMLGYFIDHIEFLIPEAVAIDDELSIPTEFTMTQNFPNPFNPSTTIRFALPEVASARLQIFDIQGKLVQTISSPDLSAGWHQTMWDGKDNDGQLVSAGVYMAKLNAGVHTQSIKMLLLK